jgi:uncharacterized protein YdeI (BOF family)
MNMKNSISILSAVLVFTVVFTGVAQSAATPEKITKIEDVTPGASVALQGKVTRILDEDEFRLADETGSIRIYIGWRNRVMVTVGESVTVRGFVDDDLVNVFRPEVYASELVREEGTVVQLN